MTLWQTRSWLTWLLSPFSLIFWIITQTRRWLFCKKWLKSYRSPVPVLVVGNISVGGNGKTPVVIWLVEQLTKRNIKVAVISRGYGGTNKTFPRLVTPDSDPSLVGDEPVLIAKRTQVPVAISPNRQQSIELLLQQFTLDLIITDDGLQHYALDRDMEWVVIDGQRRFGNGFLLPAGGLRELPSRLNSVDALICNGGVAADNEYVMQLKATHAINVKTGEKRPLSSLQNTPCVAIAGIGYPPRFFNMLKEFGINPITEQAFADHQAYSPAQLSTLTPNHELLLMTEKDAVKCTAFTQANWWFVPVEAQFSKADSQALIDPILTKIIRENRQ